MSVVLTLMQTGCGLEQIRYLQKPEALSEVFSFGTNTGAGTDLLGYEVYYKLYADEQSQEIQGNLATLQALLTAGYRRLTPEPDGTLNPDDKPLIAVPESTEPHSVTINFPARDPFGAGEPYATTSWELGVAHPVRRGIRYPASEDLSLSYETFRDFDANDADVTQATWTQIEGTERISIALYVLAYGYDTNTYQPVHSEPTYLSFYTIDVGKQTP